MASKNSNGSSEPRQSTVKATNSHGLNYDDILDHLGEMGKFQLWTFLWLCLPAFFPGIVIMSHTFTGAIPDYRCYSKGCEDDNITFSTSDSFTLSLLNKTILINKDNNEKSKCYNDIQGCNFSASAHDIGGKCDRWVYDTSVFHSTTVSEFGLICDNEWKQTLTNSLFMFGMLVGGVTIGFVGDIIGRRKTFTLNIFVLACITTASAFSPDWITFCVMRFLSGICACGHFLVVFIWGVEAVGKKYRVLCGFVYQIMFALGSAFLGLVAYFIRDWRLLQLVISIPMFCLTALFWILPESIRWLISKKHYHEVRKLVLRAADVNGTLFPERLFHSCEDQGSPQVMQIGTISTIDNNIRNEGGDEQLGCQNISNLKDENLVDIFRSKILIKRILLMFLAWIAGVMGYYGITYSATNLSGNVFINYELSILVELPAYLLGLFVVDKLGRRTMLSGGLIISGVGCLVSGLVPTDWSTIQTIFSLIGKLFIACVMATLFSYTSEIFPTSSRSAMVGLCSTSGRLSGILAPIISDWGRETDQSKPFITFAAVNISVGILCLLLPETKGTPLPATINEAIAIEKNLLSCLRTCGEKKPAVDQPI